MACETHSMKNSTRSQQSKWGSKTSVFNNRSSVPPNVRIRLAKASGHENKIKVSYEAIGYFGVNGRKPRIAKLVLKNDENDCWFLVNDSKDCTSENTFKFETSDFKNLPDDFFEQCKRGEISIRIGGLKLLFKPTACHNVMPWAKTLLEIKEKVVSGNYGSRIHDMLSINKSPSQTLNQKEAHHKNLNENKNQPNTPSVNKKSHLADELPSPPRQSQLVSKASALNIHPAATTNVSIRLPKPTEPEKSESSLSLTPKAPTVLRTFSQNNKPSPSTDFNKFASKASDNGSTFSTSTPIQTRSFYSSTGSLAKNYNRPRIPFTGSPKRPSSLLSNGSEPNKTPKRPSLLCHSSPVKKVKLSCQVDNKENEGEIQTLPYGFPNIGNTCYMNSVLQALFVAISNCQNCEAALLLLYRKISNREGSLYLHFCRLLELTRNVNTGNIADEIENKLRDLKLCSQTVYNSFKGYSMEDAHEYLMHLIDTFSTEITNKLNINLESTAEIKNPIECFLQTTVLDVKKCVNCSNEVSTEQKHFNFVVNIPEDEKNLQSALEISFKPEKQEFKCEKCGHGESVSNTKVTQVPRILILYLKRYNWTAHDAVKDDRKVRAPKYITLDPFTDEQASMSNLTEEFKTRLEEPYVDASFLVENLVKPQEDGDKINTVDDPEDGLTEKERSWIEEEDDEEMKRAKEASLAEYNRSFSSNSNEDIEEDLSTIHETSLNFKVEDQRHCYHLMSYICHEGISHQGGHYKSCGFDHKRKKFYCFDDKRVSEISDNEFSVKASSGYLFIYTHRDVCSDNVQSSVSRTTQPFNSLC